MPKQACGAARDVAVRSKRAGVDGRGQREAPLERAIGPLDPALEGIPIQRGLSRVTSCDEHKQDLLMRTWFGTVFPPGRRATGVPLDEGRGLPRWQAGLPRLPGGLSG